MEGLHRDPKTKETKEKVALEMKKYPQEEGRDQGREGEGVGGRPRTSVSPPAAAALHSPSE